MRVLVTNDDGISAAGLQAAAQAVASRFSDVLVLAPVDNCVGAGTSTGPLSPVRSPRPFPLGGVAAIEAYSTAGPPAHAVLLACAGRCGRPPDIVVSGINAGPNIGVGIVGSGTVGAALAAAAAGRAALAISLDNHWFRQGTPAAPAPTKWATAMTVTLAVLDWLVTTNAPIVLNVNVPEVPAHRVLNVAATRLAPLQTLAVTGRDAARLEMRPSLAAPVDGLPTDAQMLAQGHVTVSALGCALQGCGGGAPAEHSAVAAAAHIGRLLQRKR